MQQEGGKGLFFWNAPLIVSENKKIFRPSRLPVI
jgi:hypothetical protein